MSAGTSEPPTLTVPLERPRFLDEVVVVPLEDGVVVDGGHELHILKGEATTDLFASLIKLMDGTRTVQQLETALPHAPSEQVRAVLSLLTELGLVEEGNAGHQTSVIANPETLAFFRRYRGATPVNRDGQEAYEKLQHSEVLIMDAGKSGARTERLKSVLMESGALRVSTLERASLKTFAHREPFPNARPLVIYMCLDGEDREAAAELDDWCAEHQLSWLRAVVNQDGGYADLGPLFNRETTSCYRCFDKMHSTPSATPRTPESRPLRDPEYFWTGMVALEVLYLLSGIGIPALGRDFRRFYLREGTSRQFRWARLPGCITCCPLIPRIPKMSGNTAESGRIDTAMVFEEFVGLASRAFSGSGVPAEIAAFHLTLSRRPKRLSNCSPYSLNRRPPKLDLPALSALGKMAVPSEKPLTIDDLATLLLMTGGARNSRSTGTVKRWAATAGNLGSVELYLAVRSVEGLAPGFYYYRPFEHSLTRFERRSGALPIEEFMHRTLPPRRGSLPEALVLFTGAFHRIARKYGSFGYRLLNLDAGAAISQLHVVGRTLNLKSQTAARWADDLIEEQLNLEPFEEQSTGVVALSRQEGLYPEAQGLPPNARHGRPGSSKETGYFFERSVEQVLKELYGDSRTSESELGLGSFEPSGTAASADEELPLVSLPYPSLGGRSVGEVLLGRESVRQFAPMPVSQQQLSTMLYWARQGDVEDWPEQHAEGHALTFLVLADRVEGLAPGAYRYKFDPENPALQFLGPLCSPQERTELFVQPEFASAPLFIWIAGNLLAACDRQGAFGHRQLLLRAGAAGHRLWMGASALGVSGCLVAGLVPGVARRQLHLDGYLEGSLFGFAAGYSAQNFVSPDVSRGF